MCLFVQVNAPLTKLPSSSSQLHCANNNNPVSHICNVRKRAVCIHGNGTPHIDAATVQKGTNAMHFSKCLLKSLQMMDSFVPAHKSLLWQCETALKVANCFLESQNSHSLYPLMDLTSEFLIWLALGSLHSILKSEDNPDLNLKRHHQQQKPAVVVAPQTLRVYIPVHEYRCKSFFKSHFFHSIPLVGSRNLDADLRLNSQASSINRSDIDERSRRLEPTRYVPF